MAGGCSPRRWRTSCGCHVAAAVRRPRCWTAGRAARGGMHGRGVVARRRVDLRELERRRQLPHLAAAVSGRRARATDRRPERRARDRAGARWPLTHHLGGADHQHAVDHRRARAPASVDREQPLRTFRPIAASSTTRSSRAWARRLCMASCGKQTSKPVGRARCCPGSRWRATTSPPMANGWSFPRRMGAADRGCGWPRSMRTLCVRRRRSRDPGCG